MAGNLQADEATCRSVLHDCDTTVKALQDQNALQQQIIKDEDDRFSTQTKELKTEQIWKPIAISATLVVIVETALLALKH